MRRACVRSGLAVLTVVVLLASAGCGDADDSAADDSGDVERTVADEEGSATPSPAPSGPAGDPPPPAPDLPRVMPLSCWLPPDSECDVREPSLHCEDEETCDLLVTADDRLVIRCMPDETGIDEGLACDNRAGLFCGPGLHCMEGVCRAFCCAHEECGADAHCAALLPRAGAMGVCMDGAPDDAPSCAQPGGICRSGEDCCSGFCHVDHCH